MTKTKMILAATLFVSLAAQAGTIVQWGAQGGDTGIVTSSGSGQNSTPSTYAPATLYNPASPNLGYNDVDSARCNKFGGAATKNQNNNFVNNAAGDYIQLLANMGAFGYYEGMLAWNGGAGASGQSAFLTSDEQLESFHVEFKQRSSDNNPVVSFLLETTAGWYISDQTATNSSSTYTVFDKDIADLTWTGYGQFGVTAGAGTAPDTADIVSVGLYLEDTNGGGNFSGGYIRNFEVTATSTIVQTDATYTDVSGAAAVTSSSDLANQGQATFTNSTVTANRGGETPEESFNDGVTAEDFANMTWFLDGDGNFPATVTLNLDVTTNTDGYDISEINSIAGWGSGTQAHQVMTVAYSVTGDAGFTSLGTFTNIAAGAGEYSRITLTDVSAGYLATGVDALQFTYTDPAGTDRLVLQEIDVIGNPAFTVSNTTYTDVSGAAAVTSSSDLANQGEATFSSSSVTANQGGETPEESFNDGVTAEDFANMTWFHNGNGYLPGSVTLNLDVTTNTNGYEISEINSIAGWGSADQADQVMTVEYSVIGDAGFTSLGTFTNTDAGAGEYSRINLNAAGYLATGVDALRFTYAATGLNLVLQEIDVIGVAVAVPVELELSSMFSDDMILQREKTVPVWGTSTAGADITVEFAGQTKTTTAAGDGTWQVDLDSMTASAVSRTLTVTAELAGFGTTEVSFTNVLVGEVWLCSGQSNMALTGAQTLHQAEIEATPTDANLRLFKIPQEGPATPLERLDTVWTESTTGSSGTARSFSAVAYYFGLKLKTELGVPVGLIQSAKGGTIVEKWLPAGTSYNGGSAGIHYNGMIDAIIPFAMRGVTWYQGESNLMGDGNDGQPLTYVAKKKALIDGWRSLWGEGLPFFYVQIAPYDYTGDDDGVLPFFWEAQSAVLGEVANAGMAVITDAVHDSNGDTDLTELHPRNKQIPGERLALLALDNTYGQSIVSTGPTFQSLETVGNTLEVTFDSAVGLTTSDSLAPDWFELEVSEGVYTPATAVVSGNKVILSAVGVTAPTTMRFAWSELAQPNLRNGAGLVAAAFREETTAPTGTVFRFR